MASDLKQGRRRAPSNAAPPPQNGSGRRQSKQGFTPKSTHTSDDFLRDFLNPAFDPASYLNATLPPLAQKSGGQAPGAVRLAELTSQAQTLLLQLNAQTTRLSNTLTQLTDDILRSGSRLAYEVELLRGEALGLEETMTETLQEEVAMFVPGGLKRDEGAKEESKATGGKQQQQQSDGQADGTAKTSPQGEDPAYIKQLQTLTLVRARLDSVIKTFGDAIEFVFPPSEVSVSSGFLSVSAPEPGSEQQSSEEKGQKILKSLRDEISNLLNKSGDPVQGIEKAAERVEELKELTTVWKGTAEEKGRNKFIEGLTKMVEDRHRELLREVEQAKRETQRQGRGNVVRETGGASRGVATDDGKALPGGFGLISQLQMFRGGI
ncbi:hypothetical protein PT974_00456 [Cladobotryum mycophilum]|uniref:Uncharacterized protein n=1 Tax=Cladobotryum mycophilum TaxID=491253 RepID=A0ABR0T0W9_9HYPO